MELGLRDRVAIITGASRGIGRQIALDFAARVRTWFSTRVRSRGWLQPPTRLRRTAFGSCRSSPTCSTTTRRR